MKGLERTAKAWMDAVQAECPILPPISVATVALQRALLEIAVNEQELADCKQEFDDYKQELSDFRQDVSDAVELSIDRSGHDGLRAGHINEYLGRFIIPAPKPDPLVGVLLDMGLSSDPEEGQHDAKWLRIKLDALGFEIREKNDGTDN